MLNMTLKPPCKGRGRERRATTSVVPKREGKHKRYAKGHHENDRKNSSERDTAQALQRGESRSKATFIEKYERDCDCPHIEHEKVFHCKKSYRLIEVGSRRLKYRGSTTRDENH